MILTITNVDNSDILQSHVALYWGKLREVITGQQYECFNLIITYNWESHLPPSTAPQSEVCPQSFPACSVMTHSTLHSDSSQVHECPSPVSTATYLGNDTGISIPLSSQFVTLPQGQ